MAQLAVIKRISANGYRRFVKSPPAAFLQPRSDKFRTIFIGGRIKRAQVEEEDDDAPHRSLPVVDWRCC